MKKNILLFCISAFLGLGLTEIVLRLGWEMSGWVKVAIYKRSSNPFLRYELVPLAEFSNTKINASGFRGPDYAINKPPGTFRIIMLGDSETLSVHLPEKQTLPSQLEALLNKASTSLRYQVLNFGLEGYGTLQELEQLKTKGLKYQPDLVILNYVLNDPDPGEYYFAKTFLMRHSALARYLVYRTRKALIRREREKLGIHTEIDHFYYYHQPKFFTPVKKAILEMAEIAKERKNKLVVVIFPTSSLAVRGFKEAYPYRKIHALLKSINSDNIVFIDLIDEFQRLGLGPQDVSLNYKTGESHKNAGALQVAAEFIYRNLKSQSLIPPATP